MVTDKLRSYFLNEVDGLESNNGIYMLGTTNHCKFTTNQSSDLYAGKYHDSLTKHFS